MEHTVFISYSWTLEQHRQWVLELAKQLRSHGINVILDVWYLKTGHDKHAFMERMVTDPGVKRVLIICDQSYQQKADQREGGVGDETLLITPEVYGKVDQEKFIPIVVERDKNDGAPYMPAYLRSRMYIDMSVPTDFEDKYQELLRNLYGEPETTPPPLGKSPSYITGAVAIVPEVANTPPRLSAPQTTADSIARFFDQFLADLESFRFKSVVDEPYDDTIMNLIEGMRPLRDSFIMFASYLSQSELSDADLDQLHDYLERFAQFQFRSFDVSRHYDYDWDNYRFICYESFLYLTAALVRRGKFGVLAEIVHSTYFYDSNLKRQVYSGIGGLFNSYILSLDGMRNSRLNLRRVSVTADLMKTRAEGTGVPFDDLVRADLLLHYLTFLQADVKATSWQSDVWFPFLSPYAANFESIPILQRLVSIRQFNRVKILFDVDSPDVLRDAIERAGTEKSEYYPATGRFQFSIPQLAYAVPLDRLASVP